MISHALELQADRAAARGDIAEARRLLEEVVAAAPDSLDSWLKLAAMRRAGGDTNGALTAISGALRVDPLHFVALLSRARLLEAAGQPDEAARCYIRALAQRRLDEPLSPGLEALVEHAVVAGEAYRSRVSETYLAAAERDGGLAEPVKGRVSRFMSNALRKSRVYHSDPTHYHYPGLIEREFHDRADFPYLPVLEAATADITAEFLALQETGRAHAEPYIQYSADAPLRQWSALNHSLDWTAVHLLQGGRRVTENADRCPRTMAVLDAIDQPRIAGRSPNAMFSLLKPRTRIPPHTGVANTRLVCHLPLVVPAECWFRVGDTRIPWVPGHAFVFDDTIEHEAANDSDEPRIVLIIDLWHPGLDPVERRAIARVMEADTTVGGTPL